MNDKEKKDVELTLAKVYDFLVDILGKIAIRRKDKVEICKDGQNAANRKKMNRLFYPPEIAGEYQIMGGGKTPEGDINYLVRDGLIRNDYSGNSYFEQMIDKIVKGIKPEIKYLEDIIETSLLLEIWEIECNSPVKIECTFDEIQRIREKVLNEYKEQYENRKKELEDIINEKFYQNVHMDGFGTDEENLSVGEKICILIAYSLIVAKVDEEKVGKGSPIRKSVPLKQAFLQNYLDNAFKTESLDDYYIHLWNDFHIIKPRDGDDSILFELTRIYILPHIVYEDSTALRNRNITKTELPLEQPFQSQRTFLQAGSGYGKSTLLQSVLISCIVEYIYEKHDALMSETEKEAYRAGEYKKIYTHFFGECTFDKIPILIKAKNFHNEKDKIMSLTEEFEKLPQRKIEKNAQRLLFLIDSLDEVKDELVLPFKEQLTDMIQQYDQSQFIITSRYSGRDISMDNLKYFRLDSFQPENIEDYVSRLQFLTEEKKKQFIDFALGNSYAFMLAQNPFMLFEMLYADDNGHYTLVSCLGKITNAIIRKRFVKPDEESKIGFVLACLSYLAYDMVFFEKGDSEKTDSKKIRVEKKKLENIIRDARKKNVFKLYDVFDVTDEQISLFLKELSSQSGILNVAIEGSRMFYFFQDDLVMGYLCADFLLHILEREEYPDDEDEKIRVYDDPDKKYITRNKNLDERIREIDRRAKSFYPGRITNPSAALVCSLLLVMSPSYFAIPLLYCLLTSGFMSVDPEEQCRIKRILSDYHTEKLGDDNLIDRKSMEEKKRIESLLERYFSMDIKQE